MPADPIMQLGKSLTLSPPPPLFAPYVRLSSRTARQLIQFNHRHFMGSDALDAKSNEQPEDYVKQLMPFIKNRIKC